MINVVLAEGHSGVRGAIKALLADEPDLMIVGEAKDGLEALSLVENLCPNVLVIELNIRGAGGIEVARHLREHSSKTAVVIVSLYDSYAYVLEALNTGARSYVVKQFCADGLPTGIREAAAGRRYLSPPLSEQGLEEYRSKVRMTDCREEWASGKYRPESGNAIGGENSQSLSNRPREGHSGKYLKAKHPTSIFQR